MSPETGTLNRSLEIHQRRFRLAAFASTVSLGAVAASLVALGLMLAGRSTFQIRLAAIVVFVLIVAALGRKLWRAWTLTQVATVIEARTAGLDNLVVTAEEVSTGHRRIHPSVRDELFTAASTRLQSVVPDEVQPLRLHAAIAVLTVGAAVILIATPSSLPSRSLRTEATMAQIESVPLAPGDLHVTVLPPSYTGRRPDSHRNPAEIEALEGSRIRFESVVDGGRIQLVEAGHDPVPFAVNGDRWTHEFTAISSRILLVRWLDAANREPSDRLLHVRVDADRRPVVRIVVPAKDLIFGVPTGQVTVEIEARDDLGLASVALRYTRVTGSGETFTFEEGDVPVQIARASDGDWRARATLSLDAYGLADGDALVYRALASDRKPGADASASESFLIEIGRLAGAASTGFAIPDERDRQAISQQMLIIKTERLQAQRPKIALETFEDQSRLLAAEQRMVKAEFVFMTGGEVADEVQEAEHAHELAEGRLENAAQVELLTAIREMSRAEAALNSGDTTRALVFERAALAALQRAFDRRRYLLRALPERARIDPARRLAGDRSTARPLTRQPSDPAADQESERARAVLIELGKAIDNPGALDVSLASRVLALDPDAEPLKKIVIAMTTARDLAARVTAARAAQSHLLEWMRTRLAARSRSDVVGDPLQGRLAEELSGPRGHR